MASRTIRPLTPPFQVEVNGQTIDVTHEALFVSGGHDEPWFVQWRTGYLDGLGQFVKVATQDPRTAVIGYKVPPLRMRQIMDRTPDGNFDLLTLITEASQETPFNFRTQQAEGRVARVQR